MFQLYGVASDLGCQSDSAQSIDSRNGPDALRRAYQELHGSFNVPKNFIDHGNLNQAKDVPELLQLVQDCVAERIKRGEQIALLGGAHTLTLGSLRGLHQANTEYSLIYFDAHPDCMPEEQIHYGSTLFHAVQEGVLDPKRIVFVGIRQIEAEERDFISKHKIRTISSLEIADGSISAIARSIKQDISGPYYLSFDLDVIDPAYAPGVSTPYPLGCSPLKLSQLAKEFCDDNLLGFEIVELAPKCDISNQTARIAASLLQQFTQ